MSTCHQGGYKLNNFGWIKNILFFSFENKGRYFL